MIIGLTGTLAAGKGVVSEFLKKKGFVQLTMSDELRQRLKDRNIEITRDNLQIEGNQLRKERGAGALAELLLQRMFAQHYSNVIIDGIRNPGEIEALRKGKNFFLVAVDAPQRIRFERIKSRNREHDPKTWEEFLNADARELGEDNPEGLQIRRCMAVADFVLINETNLEEAEWKVKEFYDKILQRIPRLSWDEYFMKMAALVAERSTCLRHHIGAVIVKDKRVMSTGYNGAARGTVDCMQRGCAKNQLGIKSGTGHEVCRAIHAEQNAIIQGAIHGIKMEGGTIYCTHTPCGVCAKEIVQAGIKRVVSYHDYTDQEAINFLKDGGVELVKSPRPEATIEFRD